MVRKVCEFLVHSELRQNLDESTVNNYTIDLGQVLKNVERFEVLYAEIPNTYYNIDSTNNELVIWCTGQRSTFTIPVGTYSVDEVVVALNTAIATINVAGATAGAFNNLGEIWNFRYDTIVGEIYAYGIGNAGPEGTAIYMYKADNPSWLGLNQDILVDPCIAGVSHYMGKLANLGPEPVLYLAIPEFDARGRRFRFGNSQYCPLANEYIFTRFQMPVSLQFMHFFSNEHGMHEKTIDPQESPLHLSKLTFRFLKKDGSLVDFNGYNHSLHLRITYND